MNPNCRLFFGAQIESAWPTEMPQAKIIAEEQRHITLAFLKNCNLSQIQNFFPEIPLPSFLLGEVGIQENIVFLPETEKRVVASSIRWLLEKKPLLSYREILKTWLEKKGFSLSKTPFFPHISIGRRPFDQTQWRNFFYPLPFYIKAICLYQSIGNLCYLPLWTFPLLPPFVEIDHSADIAFLIRGYTISQIHLHAQIALAFKFPKFIHYFSSSLQESLEEIVIALNQMVTQFDMEVGCPIKAISFHGKIFKDNQQLLNWEMIVDV